MIRFATLALLLALAPPALAQRAPAATGLERGADPERAVTQDGRDFLNSGYAAVMTAVGAPARGTTAEHSARLFLADRAQDLGGADAQLDLVSVRERRSGTMVRFQQTVAGVPVWGAVTVVTLDPAKQIQFVSNGLREDVAVDVTPSVSQSAAAAAVLAHIGASRDAVLGTDLIVWPSDPARLAWSVRASGHGAPTGDWHGVVDARSGELIRVADRAAYHGGDDDGDDRPVPTALPLAELAPGFSIRGYGFVYDPDPPTAARALYGGDIVDGNDATNETLDALRKRVVLRDLTVDEDGMYELSNQWADITDWDSPFKGDFRQDSLNFLFDRSQDSFEAVSAFYHIDQYMRYVNETLQVDVRPSAYTGGVRFDPNGLDGQDNSRYQSGTQRITFGEGNVDDAECADVIIHELGHGLHDWVTDGGLSNFDGLSEGIGDYLAVSYARSLNLMTPDEPKYNWVFRWVGHNPFWVGRITNYSANYPTGQAPHTRGQHWSTSLLRVWDGIGREATDLAMFEGLARTTSSTSQPQAALAVVQAAVDLGYPDSDVQLFIDSFNEQGYNLPPLAAELPADAALQGVLLSAASPNPFNGLTTFDVMVDAPQAVTVEVFDAVGRQVAVLFEGEMTGGQRFPMSLDSAELQSGVYIVRVTGESVATTRRVTVVR